MRGVRGKLIGYVSRSSLSGRLERKAARADAARRNLARALSEQGAGELFRRAALESVHLPGGQEFLESAALVS